MNCRRCTYLGAYVISYYKANSVPMTPIDTKRN